jgi:cell division protein FtsQ
MGASDYLHRYKIYVGHVQEWRQQFQKLESVDLRYDNQIIVNPDMQGTERRASLTPASAKAAAAAGVKPAALITPIGAHDKAVPKPAFELPESKLHPNLANGAKKPAATTKTKKIFAKAHKAAAPKKAAKPAPTVATKKAAAPKSAQPANRTPASVAKSAGPKPSPAIAKQVGNAGPN